MTPPVVVPVAIGIGLGLVLLIFFLKWIEDRLDYRRLHAYFQIKELEGRKWICTPSSEKEFNEFKEKLQGKYSENDVKAGFCICDVNRKGNTEYWKILKEDISEKIC